MAEIEAPAVQPDKIEAPAVQPASRPSPLIEEVIEVAQGPAAAPPIPTPPAASEEPKYVPRMPMPVDSGDLAKAVRLAQALVGDDAAGLFEGLGGPTDEDDASETGPASDQGGEPREQQTAQSQERAEPDGLPVEWLTTDMVVTTINAWMPPPLRRDEELLLRQAWTITLPKWAELPGVLLFIIVPRLFTHPTIGPALQRLLARIWDIVAAKEEPEAALPAPEQRRREARPDPTLEERERAARTSWDAAEAAEGR